MQHNPLITDADRKAIFSDAEKNWNGALPYLKARGSVLFISGSRFWESHGFVQQSLAKLLVDNGIRVTWFDAMGWRPYKPVLYWKSPLLNVRQMPSLPLRRFAPLEAAARVIQKRTIDATLKRMGGNPVIWLMDDVHDGVVKQLPYIDVLSVFDNPYFTRNNPECLKRAKLVVTQNSFAWEMVTQIHPGKTKLSLPPMEIPEENFASAEPHKFPDHFPKKVMGYIGSFFPCAFDLLLFETFIRSFPDWGFVLMGRTDAEGEKILKGWNSYRNFVRIPWSKRDAVASVWKTLDVTLLFYRPFRAQDGAFPVKVLESLYFGVPCVATQTPKTRDLKGFFPVSPFADRLKTLATNLGETEELNRLKGIYSHFASRMHPMQHLANVVSWLQSPSGS
jgi:glycosyltransferase involved in cell wall biosynthesis